MRANQRIKVFLKGEPKHYDTTLGKMVGGDDRIRIIPCFVSDMGMELKSQLFDKVSIDAKVIRFNHQNIEKIARVVIGEKPYAIISQKQFVNGQSILYVSEVIQNEGAN